MKKRHFMALAFGLVFGLTSTVTMATEIKTTDTGLKYQDTIVGSGSLAESGKSIQVHYTGFLDIAGTKGKKFDSSVDRGTPFQFMLGSGQVIAGWEQGFAGMKIGGKRTLYIPANLGYGSRGAGAAIPPNANLIFDVELLGVE